VINPEVFDTIEIGNSAGIASLKYLPRTESTSDIAMSWIRGEDVPTPALVLTADQTRGRGQQDRTWHSAPGNLAATWIFSGPVEPSKRAEWAGRISLAAALALYDTLACQLGESSLNLFIKWPNDIWLGKQKISGILIETSPGTNCSYAVVGIGVNVNRPVSDIDPDFSPVAGSATSIRQHTGQAIDLTGLVIDLSRNLIQRLESISGEQSGWESEYNSKLMSMNRQITIKTSNSELRGCCRGILPNGALQVETATGIQIVSSGSLFPDSDS